MINSVIGKYKILRLIGEGGMASVYEAEHELLGTKVAIKVLNPILSANTQIRERFRNEAKLMASLDHPNITKVIDFDEQAQQLSIVMEYLNGEDLNQKIKRTGPLSEKEITDVFSQTLSAFQYAHEKGIVHRDIKPSNIFILPNGHVKILDFGIAKLFGQGNEMTQTGTQIGTPIYMSPEQVKADKSIDYRSDIYSLGVTLYFAINGKPPYNSDTDSQFDIFTKIVYEPIPEFSIQNRLKELVLKACQKNREERFQSCDEWLKSWPESNSKSYTDKTNSKDKNLEVENSVLKNHYKEDWQKDNEVNLGENKNKKNLFYAALILSVIIVLLVIGFNKGIFDSGKKNNTTNESEPAAGAKIDSAANGEEHAPPDFSRVDTTSIRFLDPSNEAQYNGDWSAYISKTINHSLDDLVNEGQSGTCEVLFTISEEGTVSDVEALTMKGTLFSRICVDAIKKGGHWKPGRDPLGNPVPSKRIQKVKFVVPEE